MNVMWLIASLVIFFICSFLAYLFFELDPDNIFLKALCFSASLVFLIASGTMAVICFYVVFNLF